ncbi:MAG: hypothetical protein JW849_00415 [Phycisphaerae bacterium]|nr:hypothetical protein [Phycisphaerae bacterium]
MKYLLGLLVVALCAAVALAEETSWQCDPAVVGDWFYPANWTFGIPTADINAYIQNGGTAGIHAGNASAKNVYLGETSDANTNTGVMVQTGGNVSVSNYITLTGLMDRPGTYTMMGGALDSGGIQVGRHLGNGLFTQIGGSNTTDSVTVGHTSYSSLTMSLGTPSCLDDSLGTYELIGGQLTTLSSNIGTSGRGRFIQTGGIHEVSNTLTIGGTHEPIMIENIPDSVFIGGVNRLLTASAYGYFVPGYRLPHPSDGLYELQGGQLNANEEVIQKTGVLRQTGGRHVVDYLTVTSGGEYTMSGGILEIQSGLEMDGEMDLKGSNVEIQGGGILNFGQGQLLNSQNASIHAGSNSLTILPKDFDPAAQLGNIQSDGLVHVSGNDLIIQTNDTVIGRGVIDEHVVTSGQIIAAEGEGIDINGGLYVHEGVVDLGSEILSYYGDVKKGHSEITIRNQRSGIEDGSISAMSMTVGTSPRLNVYIGGEYSLITADPTGKFNQNGGTVNLSDHLEVTRGSYELHRGICNVENYVRVGSMMPINIYDITNGVTEPGRLAEISDSIGPIIFPPDIPDEYISRPYSTFEVHGGILTTPSLYITSNWHDANFIQTGGIVRVYNRTYIGGNYPGSYTMYGGELETTDLDVGASTLAILDSDSLLSHHKLNSSSWIQF